MIVCHANAKDADADADADRLNQFNSGLVESEDVSFYLEKIGMDGGYSSLAQPRGGLPVVVIRKLYDDRPMMATEQAVLFSQGHHCRLSTVIRLRRTTIRRC
jgi:hypothetical protein